MLSSKRGARRHARWHLGCRPWTPYGRTPRSNRMCAEFGHVWLTLGRAGVRACCRCGTRRSLSGVDRLLTVVYEAADLATLPVWLGQGAA